VWRRIAVASSIALAAANAAAADECLTPDATGVEMSMEGASDDLAFRVRQELRAELSSRQVLLCDKMGRPMAHLDVRISADSAELVIRDAVTAKVVERTIELGPLAQDARPVAIALAIDELLRASWAELLLQHDNRAPQVRPAAPKNVERARASVNVAEPETHAALGMVVVLDDHTAGQTRMGTTLSASWAPVPWWRWSLRFGYRRSLTAHAADGSIEADAYLFGSDTQLRVFVPTKRFAFWGFAGIDVGRVNFHGAPMPGVAVSSPWASSVDVFAGVRIVWSLSRAFELCSSLAIGAPLLDASATDNGVVVAGTRGVLLSADLGPTVLF
jgi:hypothetical protein